MTKPQVLGVVAVAALVAIFYFGSGKKPQQPAPEPKPAPTEVVKPPVKTPGKPVPKDPKATYHRVEQGGKQGPAVECSSVTPFAEGKSPAELAAIAKQKGVSVDEVKRWFVCNP